MSMALQSEVLQAREVLVDRGELAREAHPAAHRVWLAHHVVPEDASGSSVRHRQRGEHADDRRLARAAIHSTMRVNIDRGSLLVKRSAG
jgi:hypothetical protein